MKTFTLTIPGFSIAGKAWGKPSSPPLLALHGWLDNANSFDLLAPYLEKQFYFVAIDFPGHGHSSHLPAGCYYHFSDGIFTVLQIIKALDFKQVHLLGHSMGACLASLIAGVVPEQMLSLVLIEGLGPFSMPGSSCRQQLAQYCKVEDKKAKTYASHAAAAAARSKQGYLLQQHANIIAERGVIQDEEGYYWRHDRRLLHPTPLCMTEEQILSCLCGITTKSCLFWAEQGIVLKKFDMQSRMDVVTNLQVHYLPGGHHIHMEQPALLAKHLAEFY